MSLLHLSYAFIGGCFLTLQAALNATLIKATDSGFFVGVVNSFLGGLFLFVLLLLSRGRWPDGMTIQQIPWWAWFAGVMGAIYMTLAIFAVKEIGASMLMALVIAGQMGSALLVDHFAVAGFDHHPLSLLRLVGALLLVAGSVLILNF